MNYRGIIATIFAASLGASFLLAVAALSYQNRPVTDKGAEILLAIGGAMASVVGVYIGSTINKGGE